MHFKMMMTTMKRGKKSLDEMCYIILIQKSGSMKMVEGESCSSLCYLPLSTPRIPFHAKNFLWLFFANPYCCIMNHIQCKFISIYQKPQSLPGGPKKSTPLGGLIWNFSNTSGYSKGKIIISFRAFTCWESPPTASNITSRSTVIGSMSAKLEPIFALSLKHQEWHQYIMKMEHL